MRDNSNEKPCISFSAREVQPEIKPAEARVQKEKGVRPFCPALKAAAKVWRTRPWPFTPRGEPAISFRGPVAEETSNPCYTFGMANEEGPVEKALIASYSTAINSNLVTFMVNSGASGHYFDDAMIRAIKHRLQDYVYLTPPRKILATERAMLGDTAESVMQGLVNDNYGNQILLRVDIVVVPGIGHNLFSVMTAAKKVL